MTDSTASTAGWFHPSRLAYRFTILFFASVMMYGAFFATDAIAAIENSLMSTLGIGQEKIGSLYGVYSLGPMLFLFLAGYVIDRIGTRRAGILFSAMITFGAVVVAASASFWPMYWGRFIFGYGAEAALVVQNAILVRWFRGKELAFAFGVSLTIGRLGTLFTFNTEALIADRMGPSAALWVAAALCGLGMAAIVVYVILDRRGAEILELDEEEMGDRVVFRQARSLGGSFWLITVLCFAFGSAIVSFKSLAPNFFHEKWQLPDTIEAGGTIFDGVLKNFQHMFSTAPGTTSIIIFASIIFAPFAGKLIDRYGRRASILILGSSFLIIAHLVMGFTDIAPRYPMIVLGIAFVLVPASLWPSIPLLVRRNMVGTAFGVMTQIQNIGLFLFPKVNGWLRESTGDWAASQIMFAGLGLVALIASALLLASDRKNNNVLESP